MERAFMNLYPERMAENIRNIRKGLPPETKICLVVKADAYGLGAALLAPAMENRTDFFAVAAAEEALKLRACGICKPILILGYTAPEEWKALIEQEVRLTVFRKEDAEALSALAESLGRRAFVHFKIDTGMNRIGFEADETGAETIASLSKLPGLEAEGLFSHFARADEKTTDAAQEPYRRFRFVKERLIQLGACPPICHIANSAAAMVFPEAAEHMVRLGIAIYGLYPSGEMPHSVKLQPVAEVKSRIIMLKTLSPGEAVGYGGRFVAEKPCLLATVPVGYADGYTRRLSGKASVLIRGQEAPVRGNICMDQMMVEVTHIPGVKEGDEVTLIGRDGEKEIRLEDLADMSGLLNYEFQCGLALLRGRRQLK